MAVTVSSGFKSCSEGITTNCQPNVIWEVTSANVKFRKTLKKIPANY